MQPITKGLLISEYIFDNLKFSKKKTEKFDKFLENLRLSMRHYEIN